ncbi:MAG: hypothetical protein II871_08660 [Clostridia bacterium]|jgi:membrane-bound serine protease (ClpP class)|nr:hypothetical protein [Clostridia bacterium]
MLFINLAAAAGQISSEAGFFTEWLHGMNIGGVILLLVGIALIVVEMVIPGFGIAGLSGSAAVVAGLIVSSKSFGAAMFTLAIVVLLLCIAALIVFKVVFGKGRKNSKLVLNDSITSGSTDISALDAKEMIGKEGTTLTALRPSGIAMINGRRLDVLAEGEYIEKGEPVKVSAIQGLRISVVKNTGK